MRHTFGGIRHIGACAACCRICGVKEEIPAHAGREIDDRVEPMLHDWLKKMLTVTEATITFTKVDGTERVMKCTLEASKLPPVVVKVKFDPTLPEVELTYKVSCVALLIVSDPFTYAKV